MAAIYGVLMLLAFAAVAMLSSGVAAASATCADQTPLLISFSTFVMILGWVSLSVTAGRLFTVVYGGRVKEVLKEKGLAGEEGPKTDVDMLGTIFKQFDKSGKERVHMAGWPRPIARHRIIILILCHRSPSPS